VASSRTAVCTPPAGYGELFEQYGEDIRRLVRRYLGPSAHPEDVDDGLQYIVDRFMARDVIGQYKADYVSDYTGEPVKFKAFVMAKVPFYCRGMRETLVRRQGRELQIIDTSGGDEGAVPLIDLLGGTSDTYPSLSDAVVLDSLRAALAARVPKRGREPVLPLFDALAAQLEAGRVVSPGAVRRQFGKTAAEADAWFIELKDALRDITSPPPPEEAPPADPVAAADPADAALFAARYEAAGGYRLGGLVLPAVQLRAAADALKVRSGNRVLPVWTDAGHPLAGAGKTWYLGFAREAMQVFPAARTAKGGHYPGGHFGRVKTALIVGLEHLAGVAATAALRAAAAEELWEELEAVMWKLPGFDLGKVDAALEAVRLLADA
jgi:hypothetical protein